MGDGFVIMWIGMGVVFLFLLILMLFIRIVARPEKNGGRDKSGTEVSSGAKQSGYKSSGLSVQEDQEELNMVAAIALSLELARKRSASFDPGLAKPTNSAWSQAGRMALCRGPQAVSQTLAARRGRN